MAPRQLDLFGAAVGTDPARFARWAELARQVPEHVRFGTSSWTFPGWAGLVYPSSSPLTIAALAERLAGAA
jgi:hypothetical protein